MNDLKSLSDPHGVNIVYDDELRQVSERLARAMMVLSKAIQLRIQSDENCDEDLMEALSKAEKICAGDA